MLSLHNIEKSGFRKGEYVGYALGAWTIRRGAAGWLAIRQNDPRDMLSAQTLERLSKLLDDFLACKNMGGK